MSDFLSIVLVAVFYLAVAISGDKKKKAKNAGKRSARVRTVNFDRAFAETGKDPVKGRMPHIRAQHPIGADEREADCEASRIHLHETTPQQMHAAGEGEDPCHAGGAPDMQEEPAFSYEEDTDRQSDLAQDVLRGVVMSEILLRPCERAAMKRNGRSIR